MRKYSCILFLFALFCLVGFTCNTDILQPTTEEVSVQSGMPAPIEKYYEQACAGVPDFICAYTSIDEIKAHYTKYINAGGIWIIGTEYVRDEQFYAAQQVVLLMTSKRPEVREYLSELVGFRIILMSTEQPIDPTNPVDVEYNFATIPERPNMVKAGWYSGNKIGGYAAASIAWQLESQREGPDKISMNLTAVIHEFAHAMHDAIEELDPTFNDRLEAAYQDALIPTHSILDDHGLSKPSEYWAVGVTDWFHDTPYYQQVARKPSNNNDLLLFHELIPEWLPQIYLRPLEYMEEPVEWEWEWAVSDESE